MRRVPSRLVALVLAALLFGTALPRAGSAAMPAPTCRPLLAVAAGALCFTPARAAQAERQMPVLPISPLAPVAQVTHLPLQQVLLVQHASVASGSSPALVYIFGTPAQGARTCPALGLSRYLVVAETAGHIGGVRLLPACNGQSSAALATAHLSLHIAANVGRSAVLAVQARLVSAAAPAGLAAPTAPNLAVAAPITLVPTPQPFPTGSSAPPAVPSTPLVLPATPPVPAGTPFPILPPPGPPIRTITQADNGTTINLAAGDHFLLDLQIPSGFIWRMKLSSPDLIAQASDLPIPPGAQGEYVALQPGQTELDVSAGPPCIFLVQPCLPPIQGTFQVQLAIGSSQASATPTPAVCPMLYPPPTQCATPIPTPEPGNPRVITQADNGQAISLAVGDTVLLELGPQLAWSVAIGDPSIVVAVPGVMVIYGAQGLYQARAPGVTKLTATGTPNCPPGQPCSLMAEEFAVTLVVGLAASGTAVANPATVVVGPATPAPPPATATPLPGTTRTLTNADNGQTIALAVGERFTLALQPAGYLWKVSVDDPSVVAPVADAPAASGTQGIFEARAPGQTTLAANGDPACYPACLPPSFAFTVHLVVQ